MILSSQKAFAVTFEEYIVDHDGKSLRVYLTGYIDAIYDNAYLMGGCPRRLPYRPYGEFFQHIDVYIAQETRNQKKDLEKFYKMPVEPFLTAIVMKYIDCRNPESLKLENEKKDVQTGIREIARNIMEQTKRYASPIEREKDFQYEKYMDRLKNPKKYEVKCPACKKCDNFFTPTPLPEPKLSVPSSTPSIPPAPVENKPQVAVTKKSDLFKSPEKNMKITLSETPKNPEIKAPQQDNKPAEIPVNKPEPVEAAKQEAAPPVKEAIVPVAEQSSIAPAKQETAETVKQEQKQEATPLADMVQKEPMPAVTVPQQDNKPAETPSDKPEPAKQTITEKVEPLQLPPKEEAKNLAKKAIDKIQDKTNDAKYQLENLKIDFDNLDAITLPDS